MGPLQGLEIIEVAGIGPGPFAGMLLADMGARVIRIERPGHVGMFGSHPELDFLHRGKPCLCLNLKTPAGVDVLHRLVARADGLLEGFRPGVMEKLGLGPEDLRPLNERLVYGRMTGWGQTGPMASLSGHDINYIALAGALAPIGRRGQPPSIPLNLVGDFGGGGMLLAFGMVCALLEAKSSGCGQVVDAAMLDGASLLMISIFGAMKTGFWTEERGNNMLDSGAPFYNVYETADGEYMSVGAIEAPFFAELLDRLGIDDFPLDKQHDPEAWPVLRDKLQAAFRQKSREAWTAHFADSDACVAPVLWPLEAPRHAHLAARENYVTVDGQEQPAPAPRFSRTEAAVSRGPALPGQDTDTLLTELGLSGDEIAALREQGVVA